MSSINSTESTVSPSNETEYDQYYYDDPNEGDTWTERFIENWDVMLCYPLGMIMCALVIGLTFDKKHITGDYKWFILNQAIANFLNSSTLFIFNLIYAVIMGHVKFINMYFFSGSPPLWMSVFMEIFTQELGGKLGDYAAMTTLLATVLNRWMAIALPTHYQRFMTPRLIFFYCSLCYLILLPIDGRLFDMLSFSSSLQTFITSVTYLLPWIMSIVLSAVIYCILRKHLSVMTSIADKRRLKESRAVLYAIIIQTIVPIFDKGFQYVCAMCITYGLFTQDDIDNNPISHFLVKVNGVNYLLSSVYTCLVILLTMRPYREALLSLMSPITKFCKRCLKQRLTNEKTSRSMTHSTAVISIKSGRTQSDAITNSFVSSSRAPSKIIAVVS